MITIHFYQSSNGLFKFRANSPWTTVIGEFLTIDIAHMSDFLRACLISCHEEEVRLDRCVISTDGEFVKIVHLHRPELPPVIMAHKTALRMLEQWEMIVHVKNSAPSMSFSPEEFITLNPVTQKRAVDIR